MKIFQYREFNYHVFQNYFLFHSLQATAWLGFGIRVVILVFYIICVVMYGYGRKQAKIAKKNAVDKEKAKNQKELEGKA